MAGLRGAVWHNRRANEGNALTRLYFPGAIADHGECHIVAGQAHHVIHVLRLQAGAALTLFDGYGGEHAATIKRIDKSSLMLTVAERREVSRESPLKVVLAQGISSGERMDYTVQKCVELGIAAIQPLIAQRSVVRLKADRADKRVAHWQTVAAAACEQCGRNTLPQILPVQPLMKWLGAPGEPNGPTHSSGPRYLLSPRDSTRLRDLPPPQGSVTLLVGPEGGWSPDEISAARGAGFQPLTLGPRVLRTETAAVAALAAMQAVWGDF